MLHLLGDVGGEGNDLNNIGVGQGAVVISDYKLNQIRLTIQAGAGTVIEEMWDPGDTEWSIHERFWRY